MGRKATVYQKHIQEKALSQMEDSLQNKRGENKLKTVTGRPQTTTLKVQRWWVGGGTL